MEILTYNRCKPKNLIEQIKLLKTESEIIKWEWKIEKYSQTKYKRYEKDYSELYKTRNRREEASLTDNKNCTRNMLNRNGEFRSQAKYYKKLKTYKGKI